jgi:hypothetical protein
MSGPYGKRLFLHEGQIDPFYDPARFQVICAGRRWGKTELAKARLLTACLRTDGIYRYIAPTQRLARRTIWRRKLKRAVHPSWLAKPPNETNLEMYFKSGAILEVLGADDPDSLRGEGVAGAVLDEYADMKADAWDEAVRPSLADTGGWALFIGTPKSYNHFYDLWQRGHDPKFGKWKAWQFRSVDNPLLDPEEVEDARATTDPRTFRQEWEASFEAMAGRAYYAFDRKRDVAPVVLERGLDVAISFDFNLTPATAIIGQPAGQEARVWRESWITGAGGEATRASALAVKKLLDEAGWRGPVRIYGDPSGKSGKTTGPSDHAVIRKVFPHATWRIPPSAPHVRDRVAAVNTRCETMDGRRHMRIDPQCTRLIADLEQVIFKPNGDLDQTSTPMLTHISDAFGYWVHGVWPVQQHRVSVGSAYMPHLL